MKAWWRDYGIPSCLLILVAIVHIGSAHIASSLYPGSALARRNVESVLRAFEAMMLYLAVWTGMPWKPVARRIATSLICAWGAFESFQIGACRLFFPLDQSAPFVPEGKGLCDLVTGWPIYQLTLCAILLICCLREAKLWTRQTNQN